MRRLVSGACFALGYLVVLLISVAVHAFFFGDPQRDRQLEFISIAQVSWLIALLHAVPYLLGTIKWPPAPPARTALIAGLAVGVLWWVLTASTSGAESKLPSVLAWMAGILAAFFAADVIRPRTPQAKT